jgi:hypothetical protein
MTINDWFAFWRAHPSAPETKRLAFLRWQFTISTFALVFLGSRAIGNWHTYRWEGPAVPPLFVFSLITGLRYLRRKDAADKDYIDSLIRRASERGQS